MKTSENKLNLKLFYKELGQLLYAVAYADGAIKQQEIDALKEFVLKELAAHESSSDSSGMNKAFYAQFEFEELAKKRTPPQLVYLNYLTYLKANKPLINDSLKSYIIIAVEKVAGAYYNINKKEQELIEVLKSEIAQL